MRRFAYLLLLSVFTLYGSLTRLSSMGNLPLIAVQDENNIWAFPTLVFDYPNMVYTELINNKSAGIHINPTDESWGALAIRIYDYQDKYFNSIGFTHPSNGITFNYARSITDNLNIGIGGDAAIKTKKIDTPYNKEKENYYNVRLSGDITSSENLRWEVAGDIKKFDFENITDVTNNSANNSFSYSGKLRVIIDKGIGTVFIPYFTLNKIDLNRVEGNIQDTITDLRYNFQGGLGINVKPYINTSAHLVIEGLSYTNRYKRPGADSVCNEKDGNIYLGFESSIFDWLSIRSGGKFIFHYQNYDVNGNNSSEFSNNVNYFINGGIGLKFYDTIIDVVFEKTFFNTLGYLGSGKTNDIIAGLSIIYTFSSL